LASELISSHFAGLAAPQLGIKARVIMFRCPPFLETPYLQTGSVDIEQKLAEEHPTVLVNPTYAVLLSLSFVLFCL